eukprot:m.501703 g.501703  ORF g.501703 m.501703 type:complete len:168 (-) comp57333_c0_seq14:853-1356(-)
MNHAEGTLAKEKLKRNTECFDNIGVSNALCAVTVSDARVEELDWAAQLSDHFPVSFELKCRLERCWQSKLQLSFSCVFQHLCVDWPNRSGDDFGSCAVATCLDRSLGGFVFTSRALVPQRRVATSLPRGDRKERAHKTDQASRHSKARSGSDTQRCREPNICNARPV